MIGYLDKCIYNYIDRFLAAKLKTLAAGLYPAENLGYELLTAFPDSWLPLHTLLERTE